MSGVQPSLVIQIVADVLVSAACIVYLVVDVRRFLREYT